MIHELNETQMRTLPRKELIERAFIASGYKDTSDSTVNRDREIALSKLQDYQLREIISKGRITL